MLGEKLLSLLDDASLVSTYKPALLLALIDRSQAALGDPTVDADAVPVRELAERAIELYWPQTLAYPPSGTVLWQNAGAKQAKLIQRVLEFREETGAGERRSLEGLQGGKRWNRLLDRVELTLAEMPIPRLQLPYEAFLYSFDWPWANDGTWRVTAYRSSSRTLRLHGGVADSLVRLAPLMRPFILRWWTDKAASLNRHDVRDADAMIEFERFLFGRDRVGLRRLVNDLVDLQRGDCFYCRRRLDGTEIDHFLPWSYSADDGLDNLVAACRTCNNAKRAVLPAVLHVRAWLHRSTRYAGDLASIASTKQWPRDLGRTRAISRSLYLRSAEERPTWEALSPSDRRLVSLTGQVPELRSLLR